MSEEDTDCRGFPSPFLLISLFILITGQLVSGNSLQTDREVLLQLKSFLETNNPINRGEYIKWGNSSNPSPCGWPGIKCSSERSRVIGIDLSNSKISGKMFGNYSALTELYTLDLSNNGMNGPITPDVNQCKKLRYLNLSRNMLVGELNLNGSTRLESLDLTVNRLRGRIGPAFFAGCNQLVTLNLSSNSFTGELNNSFDKCLKLRNLDLSLNNFSGPIWLGFARLREYSVSGNKISGQIPPSIFSEDCSLVILDLSENDLYGEIPKELSNCKGLVSLNLFSNQFTGKIPSQIGSLSNLESLYLGSNNLSREMPRSLLNCSKLEFLDLSKNNFRGGVQEIFGRFFQLKFLLLHGNDYTGGIVSSGLLKLPNMVRLDLSNNMFSGEMPIEISGMGSLKFLILAQNKFSGRIPSEFGKLTGLQALDLSYNTLSGTIPPSIGNMTSLLWLMLKNNSLTGEIPREIGNCSSMLWLNLANNELSGSIPAELARIGLNPGPTFESNRQDIGVVAGSGECLTMKRWIPATHPPFSFVYTLLTQKSCRSIWDHLLKGYGLFPSCRGPSPVRKLEISGYLQLTGNKFSGEIPREIGEMQNFSLFHLGENRFSGPLTPSISRLPLVYLNLSSNGFSGPIPPELGDIKCLQSLDLSSNNFSGEFPLSLNRLTELNRFNVSNNPLIFGEIPATGQLATFDNDSFIGDPNITLGTSRTKSHHIRPGNRKPGNRETKKSPSARKTAFFVFLALTLTFIICGVLSMIFCIIKRSPLTDSDHLLEQELKHNMSSPSTSDAAKVFHLDDSTLSFTYDDIVMATSDFSDNMVIGKGGFGVVYRGVLQDGREVAVKKLQREGSEGEREFKAEMQVLSGSGGGGWPHPNLVMLFGWCLFGSDKLLVYEYMEGGSLEELVTDWERLGWARRVEVAIGVARALAFLHHQCFPAVVHRDVKASNVLLDKEGRPRVTDFGLARVVRPGETHVSTVVAGTVGYVAPEYGHTWQATTKGDVYSFGILLMELATGRRAVEEGGGEECLVEWVRRVGTHKGLRGAVVAAVMHGRGEREEGMEEMCELLRIGLKCAAEMPQVRPNMKEVLAMLVKI